MNWLIYQVKNIQSLFAIKSRKKSMSRCFQVFANSFVCSLVIFNNHYLSHRKHLLKKV